MWRHQVPWILQLHPGGMVFTRDTPQETPISIVLDYFARPEVARASFFLTARATKAILGYMRGA